MQDQTITFTSKIEDIRASHERGQLASHEIAKALDASDSKVASSWGPAMRR